MQIHCKYTGIKGFVRIYESGLKWRYMITDKAKHKARVVAFYQKHGLKATLDAFTLKRSTLFLWQQKLLSGQGKLESLNDQSRAPQTKRKRLWPEAVAVEIKHLRQEHPNLGKDKIYPLLHEFCQQNQLSCPKSSTVGRLIKDAGGLRAYPQKVSHFSRIKQVKRIKVLRKPKDFKPSYAGHLVALDTIEKFVHGLRRYVITFEDIYSRFSFAWATTSHASLAAKEFFNHCRLVFPRQITFALTDNGSEFKKHFNQELLNLHIDHYHTYPRTPKMNAHCERFNRTIQDEFIDYHQGELINPLAFNRRLMTWLIWYNSKRPHFAFQNKFSPLQYLLSLERAENQPESNLGWTHTIIRHSRQNAV